MEAELIPYIAQFIQWIIIGLMAIVCWSLRDKFAKTDARFEKVESNIDHIKEHYVKKDYLKLNIDHIKDTVKASEIRIIDKVDFLVSSLKK